MNVRSIRVRLTLWYAGFLLIVFPLLGVSGYFALRSYLFSTIGENLAGRTRFIAEGIRNDASWEGESSYGREIEKRYAPSANGRFYRLTKKSGAVIYCSGTPSDGHFQPSEINPVNLNTNTPTLRHEHSNNGDRVFISTLPFTLRNGETYFIEAGISEAPVEHALNWLLTVLCIVLPGLVVLGSLGGYFLIGNALRPVDALTLGAQRITAKNLNGRLQVPSTNDEIERLAKALNDMIGRLDEAFQQVTRFTGDASHELRTPLAILRAELEGFRQAGRLETTQLEFIDSAIDETDQLTHIVTGLLEIARFDGGGALNKTYCDFGDLVLSTVEQIRLMADDADLTLKTFVLPNLVIDADPTRLKQVIVNLIDNAIRYTPRGGMILVRLTGDETEAVLEVADTGIGIPRESLGHVFDRFYRVSHSRTKQVNGTGLGLSIVKSICLAHGATVGVESEPGRGSVFRVTFPVHSVEADFFERFREQTNLAFQEI